jgi:hypothetical protein
VNGNMNMQNNLRSNVKDSEGVMVHCPNPACDYTWRYVGRFSFYATCPSCRRNIKIQENKVTPLSSVQVVGPSQIAAGKTPGDDALQ